MIVELDLQSFFQSKFNNYQAIVMKLCPQITKAFWFSTYSFYCEVMVQWSQPHFQTRGKQYWSHRSIQDSTYKSLGEVVKRQILIHNRDSAFLTTSQVRPVLPVHRSLFKQQGPREPHIPNFVVWLLTGLYEVRSPQAGQTFSLILHSALNGHGLFTKYRWSLEKEGAK